MLSSNKVLSSKQKALDINLDPAIYGTFAEIGAGQETVRYFFRVGAASKTIAKAMSAYDKGFSDDIYGKEAHNRYVTQHRLRKMLRYEVALIEQRLNPTKSTNKTYFTFANTVATINHKKTYKGHGWLGIRYQHKPGAKFNEIALHVELNENDARFQQETMGDLGVNLIYGAFRFSDDPRKLIDSLYDNIDLDKLKIDMIDFSGPEFQEVDNRLMSLHLVKQNMTDAVIFDANRHNLQAADLLYKKDIFALRGSFRPVTLVNIDMFENGLDRFLKENQISMEQTEVFFEITTANLSEEGSINERDFLDRADILAQLGYNIMISNFSEYYRMVDYFSRYTKGELGIPMGVNNLLEVFNENFYTDLPGGILEAFGRFFKKGLHVYLYPYKDTISGKLLTSNNLKVSKHLKDLYKHFKKNKLIVDIENYKPEYLEIYAQEVLNKISSGDSNWEKQVPNIVAQTIKERELFGYKKDKTSR